MNVKKQLREAFSPTEPKLKDDFLKTLPYPKLSFSEFVLSQIRFIRKRVWFAALLIVLTGVFAVCLMQQELYPQIGLPAVWIVSSLTPFLAMLMAAEISRSDMYGMAELETASRFSLPQLTGARTLILGVVSFAVIAVLTVISGIFTPMGIAKSAIYILAPFLLVNGISLAVFSRFKGHEGGYISAAAAVFVSVSGVLAKISATRVSESLCDGLCIMICIFGAVTVFINMRKMLIGDKAYGTHA